MCGIVGAVAERDITPLLIEGLKRLEYRGYDSAGIALLNDDTLTRIRKKGKVVELMKALDTAKVNGSIGIAHTRWATHGVPAENNAHPHISKDRVAVVHNGIIENYEALRVKQEKQGYQFDSDTDTEVVVHQIAHYLEQGSDLLQAVTLTTQDLEGAYALGVIDTQHPEHMIAARQGSPLVVGVGEHENFIASDVQALLSVTQAFIFLENGDIADIQKSGVTIFDKKGKEVKRKAKASGLSVSSIELGEYSHYMQKEIFEQPIAISETLEGRIINKSVPIEILGPNAAKILDKVEQVQIIACGTSYHAGLIARHWFERQAGISCQAEVASEFRYRKHIIKPGTLLISISQSGETADTLAALQLAKNDKNYIGTLSVCNVPESSLVRESDLVLMTHAGPEIGVASTKAFTTQLVALMLIVILAGKHKGMSKDVEQELVKQLQDLPKKIQEGLKLDSALAQLSEEFANKQHALFLGRGSHYPIAMEGALKLKEISYIHAEAYPAGELKHGPLALVDRDMPVVAVAPNNILLEKLKSNLSEVRARGGRLHVFADKGSGFVSDDIMNVFEINAPQNPVAPIIFTIPLQLLAYHCALIKGTDVDQPRNLAKSVTVE